MGTRRNTIRPAVVPVAPSSTESTEKKWNTPANLLSLAATLFSLVALLVSIKSCQISNKQVELGERDFYGQRSLVLSAEVATNQDEMHLHSVDSSIGLQFAYLTFPSEFGITNWDVMPPDFGFALVLPRYSLENIVLAMHPAKKGFYVVSTDSVVPFAVTASYTARGTPCNIRSLYLLSYTFVLGDKIGQKPTIKFGGIALGRHLEPNEDLPLALEHLWLQIKARQADHKGT